MTVYDIVHDGWNSPFPVSRQLPTFPVMQYHRLSFHSRRRNARNTLMYCNILSFWRLRRFTEDHARVSESGNENISSSNRPSTLERNYEQFYDHERMDAVDCIENSRIKKERTKWTEVDDQLVASVIFEVNIFRMARYQAPKRLWWLQSLLYFN